MKDWTGNSKTTYATLGSSQHSEGERAEHDYYATEPKAVKMLLQLEQFDTFIWEPACGEGHISKVLDAAGYVVESSDLIDRDYGQGGIDFLAHTEMWDGDIVTNPPYSMAAEFITKALSLIPEGRKVAMFLKLTFLESKGREELFGTYPPKIVYVTRNRLTCAKNGKFSAKDPKAVAYAWFIWVKGFKGDPVIKWFN